MVCVFAHQDVRQQPGACNAALDRPACRRRLHDRIALAARVLGPHVADHLEARRHDLQHFARVFAQVAQLATTPRAAAAFALLRFVACMFARQVPRQRLAAIAGLLLAVVANWQAALTGSAAFALERLLLGLELLHQQLQLAKLAKSLGTGTIPLALE